MLRQVYVVIHWDELEGGVLILAHHSINAEPHGPQAAGDGGEEICSAEIYPTTSSGAALPISRIYIPPERSAAMGAEALVGLCQKRTDALTQYTLSHLIVGDLNVTTWLEAYEEWCATEGLRALNDPEIPAH